MAPHLDTKKLSERLWLKTGQAARLYGHDAAYWAALADSGKIRSKREGKRGDRYLLRGEYNPDTDEAFPDGSIEAHMRAPAMITLASQRRASKEQRQSAAEFRRKVQAVYEQKRQQNKERKECHEFPNAENPAA